MKLHSILLACVVAAGGVGYVAGCDKEVAHEKDVKVTDNGTVKTNEKTVTKSPNGDVKITEEKKVDKP